jgi:cytochrome P450
MIKDEILASHVFLKNTTEGNVFIAQESKDVFFALTSNAIEDVFVNKYSSFVKDGAFKKLEIAMGKGIGTSEEPKHMNNKKEISPAFTHDKLNEYKTKILSNIDSMLDSWSEEVNITKEMKFFIFQVSMEIFFSEKVNDDFRQASDDITVVSEKLGEGVEDDELLRAVDNLSQFNRTLVDKRLESKENKNDFLDMLINSYNNKKIDFDDLYDEMATIIATGYESTGSAIQWAIYYLSTNKNWQEKISEEKYLDAFIDEVLRMCPPIWISERVAIEDVDIDGTHLPSGTKVIVSSFAMQRDKNVFEDPQEFIPERWLTGKKLSRGQYFPFLFGKRQCIAREFALMEIRLVLTEITKRFEIELVDNGEVYFNRGLTHQPNNDIIVRITNK